jgi:hypothetical protein
MREEKLTCQHVGILAPLQHQPAGTVAAGVPRPRLTSKTPEGLKNYWAENFPAANVSAFLRRRTGMELWRTTVS